MDVVARHWPAFASHAWHRLGGGFSGAVVFTSDSVILKGWPPGTSARRVEVCHDYQSKLAESLEVVPRLLATTSGNTWCEFESRIWELTPRQPGRPAMESEAIRSFDTIAEMHRIWNTETTRVAACPVTARVNHVLQTLKVIATSKPDSELLRFSQRAATARIHSFPGEPVTALCHGDVHREHILFEQGHVSGLIDFASIKRDHPALDLARYFGDFNDDVLVAGVEQYRACGGFPEVTVERVRYLDCVITLGAACHWIQNSNSDDPAVPIRMERLIARLRRQTAVNASAFAAFP